MKKITLKKYKTKLCEMKNILETDMSSNCEKSKDG